MTAHYLMIGGFLGAGKTTALLRAGEILAGAGRRVGLIVNDQSSGLVDTALVRARELAVQEVAGGCFCCRFNSLLDAAERLASDARPDVFLAEPVGSCTDLVATVAWPLRQMYGDRYRVAPLSVLVDPDRALRVLGLEPGGTFSPKVLYVYEKQLEEADLLVINKIDRLSPDRLHRLRDALHARFPSAVVRCISARTGEGVAEWMDQILAEGSADRAVDVNYDTYAEGEALLGWLNATVALSGTVVDGDDLLLDLARRIHAALADAGVEIAHLKLTLTPAGGQGISVVNATRTDTAPELAFRLDAELESGEVTVNLRAEADPERLEIAVREALRTTDPTETVLKVAHLERFRPARPVPTHRVAALSK